MEPSAKYTPMKLHVCKSVKGKGNVVPVRAMRAYSES
jgi:hypothetical protein